MATGKPSNSEASSQESDNTQLEEKSNEDSTGVGRSYECTFCKRGFTNAQALGGHMNIHRKDKAKAKAKQKIKQEETSNKSNLRHMSSQVSTTDYPHHDQQPLGFQRVVGGQMNYQVYMPSPNPNFQTGNYLPLWRPERLQSGIAENLRLRMGISPSKNEDGDGGVAKSNLKKENDVDLELRLGHQP